MSNPMNTSKQMTPLGYKAAQVPGPEYQSEWTNGPQGAQCKPSPGQPPKSAMVQTLFGGKNPA
jgi:hypothetical protein